MHMLCMFSVLALMKYLLVIVVHFSPAASFLAITHILPCCSMVVGCIRLFLFQLHNDWTLPVLQLVLVARHFPIISGNYCHIPRLSQFMRQQQVSEV